MDYRATIREHLKRTGESQNALAKKIGFSGAALSSYLSGNYSNAGALEEKIDRFFRQLTLGETSAKKPDFVRTSIADTVLNTITYCHIQHCMGAIYGDAGVGKTMSITKYASENSEAYLVTAAQALSRPVAPYTGARIGELQTPEELAKTNQADQSAV